MRNKRVSRKSVLPKHYTLKQKHTAARKLQGIYRAKMCRQKVRLLIRSVYEKIYDPATGTHFFYNKHTGESTWTQPKILGSEEFDAPVVAGNPEHYADALASLAQHWEEYEDNQGTKYYHNKNTKETVWDKPEIMVRAERAKSAVLGPDWEEHKDDEGTIFYYNKKTGESSWDKPKVKIVVKKSKKVKMSYAKYHEKMKKKQKTKRKLNTDKSSSSEDSSDGSMFSDSDESAPPELLDFTEAREDQLNADYANVSSSEEEEEGDGTKLAAKDDDPLREETRFAAPSELEVNLTPDEYELKRRRERRERRQRKLELLKRSTKTVQNRYCRDLRIRKCKRKEAGELELVNLGLGLFPTSIFETSEHLTKLNVSFNFMEALPIDVKVLTSLEHLNLSHNRFVDLPAQLFYSAHLVSLDLRNNQLAELPHETGNMVTLRDLNLWELTVGALTSLQELRLDHNELLELPEQIAEVESLRCLTVAHNQLEFLPDELTTLRLLTRLDISGNSVAELPEDFADLVSLQDLRLSYNGLKLLPPEIGRLVHLISLDARYNNIANIPFSISECCSLQFLDLCHNEISMLPPKFGSEYSFMKVLDLSHNNIKTMPESFSQMESLQVLLMNNNRLEVLPSELGKLSKLRKLHLSHNSLESVECSFDVMEELMSLDLSHNLLSSLSTMTPKLCSLLQLDISHNQFRDLPAQILSIKSLTTLDFSHNEIGSIPSQWDRLQRLSTLRGHHNRLEALNSSFANLSALRCVSLCHNQLSHLPPNFSQLASLQKLDLSHNLFTVAPFQLKEMPELVYWKMHFNPVVERKSRNKQAHELMAQADALMLSNRPAEAHDVYHKSLQLHPSHYPNRGLLNLKLGIANRFKSDYAASISNFNSVIADISDVQFESQKVPALYSRALSRFDKGEITSSLKDFVHVIELFPSYLPAYSGRALAYVHLGLYKEALADVKEVLLANENDPEALLIKGRILTKVNQPIEAVECFKASIRVDPYNPHAYYYHGLALRGLGKAKPAISEFDTAATLIEKILQERKLNSVLKRKLVETLKVALLCQSSAWSTLNSTKKAGKYYHQAMSVKSRYLAQ